MARDTSIQAYRQIQAEGLLSERRFEAYKFIYEHGPLTANEMMYKAKELRMRTHIHMESLSKRLSELRDLGVIQEIGTKKCSISGRECIVWDVTSNLPVKPKKKKTSKQIIKELQEEIKELKRALAKCKCDAVKQLEIFK